LATKILQRKCIDCMCSVQTHRFSIEIGFFPLLRRSISPVFPAITTSHRPPPHTHSCSVDVLRGSSWSRYIYGLPQ
jgi:hypothetical protein